MGIFSEIAVEQQLCQMRAFTLSLSLSDPRRCSGFPQNYLLGRIESLVVVCGEVHLLLQYS